MKYIIILCSLYIAFGTNINAQQAWVQKKGEGYFQLGFSSLNYTMVSDGNYKATSIPRPVSQLITSVYGEYGISDRFTAVVTLPYHFVSTGKLDSDWTEFSPAESSLNALGNINLGLQFQILRKNNFVLATKLGVDLQTAQLEGITGLRTGYDALGIQGAILAGISNDKFFSSIETSITTYQNANLSRYFINAQIGSRLLKNKKFIFILALSHTSVIGEVNNITALGLDGNAIYTGLYLNEQAYMAGTIKVGYEFAQKWTTWISAGGGSAKHTGINPVYSLSLGYNLRD